MRNTFHSIHQQMSLCSHLHRHHQIDDVCPNRLSGRIILTCNPLKNATIFEYKKKRIKCSSDQIQSGYHNARFETIWWIKTNRSNGTHYSPTNVPTFIIKPLLVRGKTHTHTTWNDCTTYAFVAHAHFYILHTFTQARIVHCAGADWCCLLLLGRLGDHQTKRDGLCVLFPCVFVCVCVKLWPQNWNYNKINWEVYLLITHACMPQHTNA